MVADNRQRHPAATAAAGLLRGASPAVSRRPGRATPRLRSDPQVRRFDPAEDVLDEVRQRREEFAAAGRVRTHYHVPLDWDQDGPFGSTQAEVRRVLEALASSPEPLPLLGVETYTWSVLGDAFGDAPRYERIQRELDWVAAFWKMQR